MPPAIARRKNATRKSILTRQLNSLLHDLKRQELSLSLQIGIHRSARVKKPVDYRKLVGILPRRRFRSIKSSSSTQSHLAVVSTSSTNGVIQINTSSVSSPSRRSLQLDTELASHLALSMYSEKHLTRLRKSMNAPPSASSIDTASTADCDAEFTPSFVPRRSSRLSRLHHSADSGFSSAFTSPDVDGVDDAAVPAKGARPDDLIPKDNQPQSCSSDIPPSSLVDSTKLKSKIVVRTYPPDAKPMATGGEPRVTSTEEFIKNVNRDFRIDRRLALVQPSLYRLGSDSAEDVDDYYRHHHVARGATDVDDCCCTEDTGEQSSSCAVHYPPVPMEQDLFRVLEALHVSSPPSNSKRAVAKRGAALSLSEPSPSNVTPSSNYDAVDHLKTVISTVMSDRTEEDRNEVQETILELDLHLECSFTKKQVPADHVDSMEEEEDLDDDDDSYRPKPRRRPRKIVIPDASIASESFLTPKKRPTTRRCRLTAGAAKQAEIEKRKPFIPMPIPDSPRSHSSSPGVSVDYRPRSPATEQYIKHLMRNTRLASGSGAVTSRLSLSATDTDGFSGRQRNSVASQVLSRVDGYQGTVSAAVCRSRSHVDEFGDEDEVADSD